MISNEPETTSYQVLHGASPFRSTTPAPRLRSEVAFVIVTRTLTSFRSTVNLGSDYMCRGSARAEHRCSVASVHARLTTYDCRRSNANAMTLLHSLRMISILSWASSTRLQPSGRTGPFQLTSADTGFTILDNSAETAATPPQIAKGIV